MKLNFWTDLHGQLGQEPRRIGDYIEVLRKLALVSRQVDKSFCLGDLFHHRRVIDVRVLWFVYEALREHINTHFLIGNHDLANNHSEINSILPIASQFHAIHGPGNLLKLQVQGPDPLYALRPPGDHVFGVDQGVPRNNYATPNGWDRNHYVVSLSNNMSIGMVPYIHKADHLKRHLEQLWRIQRDDQVKLLAIHNDIRGVSVPGGTMKTGVDPSDLAQWDRVFAGHVHVPQELLGGKIVVVGTVMAQDRTDQGDRGWVLYDTETDQIERVPSGAPQFLDYMVESDDEVQRLLDLHTTNYIRVTTAKGITVPADVKARMDEQNRHVSVIPAEPDLHPPRLTWDGRSYRELLAKYVDLQNGNPTLVDIGLELFGDD